MGKSELQSVSDTSLAREVSRRLTGTRISDEQLLSELSGRISHLDREECYEAMEMVGHAERNSMIAIEVCDAVEFLLKLAHKPEE